MSKEKSNKYLTQKAKPLNRQKNDKFIPLTPSAGEVSEGVKYEPDRFVDHSTSEIWKAGDRIVHKSKMGKSGRAIYEDPQTWTKE